MQNEEYAATIFGEKAEKRRTRKAEEKRRDLHFRVEGGVTEPGCTEPGCIINHEAASL